MDYKQLLLIKPFFDHQALGIVAIKENAIYSLEEYLFQYFADRRFLSIPTMRPEIHFFLREEQFPQYQKPPRGKTI